MTVLAIRAAHTPQEAAPLPQSMVERMTLIMETFETQATRLTLEQIAQATSLPRSTAHRILDQLVHLDWLVRVSPGYSLGPRALGLGQLQGGDGHMDIRAAAAPFLHQLNVRTGMVVHLAVLDGSDIYYLDKLGGRLAAAVPSRIGGRIPAHRTALGKAILSWLPAEIVEEIVNDSEVPMAQLHLEMSRIRARNGLVLDRGVFSNSISCAGIAIRGPEGPVAAISLVGDASAPLELVAPLVVEASREISSELFEGYLPSDNRRTMRWSAHLVS